MGNASNFDHLEDLDPGLAGYGHFAERYFFDDANTALIKTRQFAERLAVMIAGNAGVETGRRPGFVDVLRAIQVEAVAPREVLDVLHRVRRYGNAAAHDAADERRDAFEGDQALPPARGLVAATTTGNPKLTIAFVPPRAAADGSAELAAVVEGLRARLYETETTAERLRREAAQDAWEARLTAEERAGIAEEERAIYEALALDAERRAAAAPPPRAEQIAFVTAAAEAAGNLDLDEADTRILVDDQLREAGWEADTLTLRRASGSRPERGRKIAIAEWLTVSGPADYALFIGEHVNRRGTGDRVRRGIGDRGMLG